jgi:hypothetical protein
VEFDCLQLNPSSIMDKEAEKAHSSIISFTSATLKRPSDHQLDKRDTKRRIEDEQILQDIEEPVEDLPQETPKITIKHFNVPLFKTLRKIGNKLENVNHHYDLLIDMQKKHVAPKGLKTRVNPSVPDLPTDLYTRWKEAHGNYTQSLTDILIDHWSRKKDMLTQDYTSPHSTLKTNTDKEELEERKREDNTKPKKRKKKRNLHYRRHPEDNPGRYINNPILTVTNPWTQRPMILGIPNIDIRDTQGPTFQKLHITQA